jgi:O-antigen/teichoic acid export membrane protein
MSTANLLFKSSVARTALTVVSTIVGFFMVPFVVGKLGDKWYGIWTILGSFMGYYYLVDFGLATAVTRFVTQHIARKEDRGANEIINTSLVIYSVMALVICAITAGVALLARTFISDAVELHVVKLVILVMGFNLAAEFPFKAFSGIIGAYVRYDLLTYSHFGTLLLSTGLTVIFLKAGYGIITLSLIGFVCSQISNVLYYGVARHLFSEMRFGGQYFKPERIRELFGYSVWSFVIQLGDQLRFRIDSLVIAWMMTASDVTHYYIGASLATYYLALIFRATNILTPVFTKYYAENKFDEIRAKMMFLTKISTILSVFGGGLIILVGKAFISRWMGNKYLDAYPVLVALMIAMIAEAIHNPSNNVLYAISRHRYLALVNIVEGVVNFGLSLLLVRYWGILGVALGTTIPLVVSRVFILPSYTCRSIELPIKKYYTNIMVTMAFTVGYLVLFYAVSRNLLAVAQYRSIVLLTVSALPLYALSILFISFNRSERVLLRSMLAGRLS